MIFKSSSRSIIQELGPSNVFSFHLSLVTRYYVLFFVEFAISPVEPWKVLLLASEEPQDSPPIGKICI